VTLRDLSEARAVLDSPILTVVPKVCPHPNAAQLTAPTRLAVRVAWHVGLPSNMYKLGIDLHLQRDKITILRGNV